MTHTIEKFEVRNRWTKAVQFTAEISVTADMSPSIKLGLAVAWARKFDADLRGANLRGVNLRGVNLSGADLSGADLSGADLRGVNLSGTNLSGTNLRDANLRDADLRFIKADFFMILAMGHAEVPHLIRALQDGRVDGSTYEGECACLVGTLENGGASGIPHQSSSPAEQWFVPIRKGTKPGDDSEGGSRSAEALEWALEYARLTGIELPVVRDVA